MNCVELCPYDANQVYQFSKPVNVLPELYAKNIQIIRPVDEVDGIYKAKIGQYEVFVQYTKRNIVEEVERKLSENRNVYGYWKCPNNEYSVIVMNPDNNYMMSLIEKLGCKYKSIDLDCKYTTPLTQEQLSEIIVKEELSGSAYLVKYRNTSIVARLRQLRGFTRDEQKVIQSSNGDEKSIMIERFKRELCLQSKAAKANLAARVYGYWLCENLDQSAIILQSYTGGMELGDYLIKNNNKQNLPDIYMLIIYSIISMNIDLRICNNGLSGTRSSKSSSVYILDNKRDKIPKPRFTNFSKAVECPSDKSFIASRERKLDIHLGPRIDLTNFVDRDNPTYAYRFFVDLVTINKLIIGFLENSPEGSISYSILRSIRENKFDDLKTWIDVYTFASQGGSLKTDIIFDIFMKKFKSRYA